jgi:hypothetical protein
MSQAAESVTVTLPRSAVGDVLALSDALTDRMHELLERNTDGNLTAVERAELETLVKVSQFGQILSMALKAAVQP